MVFGLDYVLIEVIIIVRQFSAVFEASGNRTAYHTRHPFSSLHVVFPVFINNKFAKHYDNMHLASNGTMATADRTNVSTAMYYMTYKYDMYRDCREATMTSARSASARQLTFLRQEVGQSSRSYARTNQYDQ